MARSRFNYKFFNNNFIVLVNFLIYQPNFFYVDFDQSFSLKEKDFFKLKFFNNLYLNRKVSYNYFFNKQIVLCKKIIFLNANILNLIFF